MRMRLASLTISMTANRTCKNKQAGIAPGLFVYTAAARLLYSFSLLPEYTRTQWHAIADVSMEILQVV